MTDFQLKIQALNHQLNSIHLKKKPEELQTHCEDNLTILEAKCHRRIYKMEAQVQKLQNKVNAYEQGLNRTKKHIKVLQQNNFQQLASIIKEKIENLNRECLRYKDKYLERQQQTQMILMQLNKDKQTEAKKLRSSIQSNFHKISSMLKHYEHQFEKKGGYIKEYMAKIRLKHEVSQKQREEGLNIFQQMMKEIKESDRKHTEQQLQKAQKEDKHEQKLLKAIDLALKAL